MNEDEISEGELEAIRQRLAAATPGPWESFVEDRDHECGSNFIRTGGKEGIEPIGATVADQDFIAHARQDIPGLLEEIERLKSLLRDAPATSAILRGSMTTWIEDPKLVETKSDFMKILVYLLRDLSKHQDEWENITLADFLSAVHGFTGDIEGYYKNRGETVDLSQPSWSLFATILMAARVYE